MGSELGRLLVLIGIVLVAVGAVLLLAERIGLGRLPGDIVVRRGNFTLYLPVATSVLLSLLLTALLWVLQLWWRRP